MGVCGGSSSDRAAFFQAAASSIVASSEPFVGVCNTKSSVVTPVTDSLKTTSKLISSAFVGFVPPREIESTSGDVKSTGNGPPNAEVSPLLFVAVALDPPYGPVGILVLVRHGDFARVPLFSGFSPTGMASGGKDG